MVYLDNAATSGVKPQSVYLAVNEAIRKFSVNPGRGGYLLSRSCDMKIFETRKKLSDFFNVGDETKVLFMPNCTTALNTVIKGVLKQGDHAVTSSIEHNAVMRPLYQMKKAGVEVDVAQVIFEDNDATVRSFINKIKPNTKLVICTHASNVTGHIMPIEQIGKICAERGIRFLVDAAQSAGVLDINCTEMNIDYLCIAAHKGLYAPAGTGVLIARAPIEKTLIEGGTGTNSISSAQPTDLPERFESGTKDVVNILGLSAGIDFVKLKGTDKIYKGELQLAAAAYDELKSLGGVIFYSSRPSHGLTVPTMSFNLRDRSSDEVSEWLDSNGICVRSGLHCAPYAHNAIGTTEGGTVRISFSAFNSQNDVNSLIRALYGLKSRSK